MPRQKFCSVPGCLSTTDVIKREQEVFLSTYCTRCSIQRPCRCPAPDIYTTRRETRTKFTSWCNAIGLRSPGYYINVCYKHFSTGCPSRTCPNPDVVKPIWEKHVKERADQESTQDSVIKKTVLVPRKRKRRRTSGPMPAARRTVIVKSDVMLPRTSSLLRDALLLPRGSDIGHKKQAERSEDTASTSVATTPPIAAARQVIVMLTPTPYATLPTSIALPQTPVPLSQLTSDPVTRSSITPPSSSSTSSLATKDDDDDIMDDLMSIDDSALLEVMDPKKLEEGLPTTSLDLPLLDQSDDPYLNEGDGSLSFVPDELDETVQKWMESCEANSFLPI